MARPKKHDGVLYRRGRFWWMRYWDRDGTRRLESTETSDWQEAQTRLRERLQARDENVLALVRRGQQLRFHEWADFFLEHYSQPPLRSRKTHAANQNAVKQLKPVFGPQMLSAIGAEDVEGVLALAASATEASQDTAGVSGARAAEAGDRAPGVSRVAPGVECRGEEEVHRGQPVQLSRSSRSRSRGCFGRTTCRGRNSSGSSCTHPRTCGTLSGSSPRPDYGSTRSLHRCGKTRSTWQTQWSGYLTRKPPPAWGRCH